MKRPYSTMVQMLLTAIVLLPLFYSSFGENGAVPNEFCEEGPPGRYCFPNLTGWHECVVDKSGKMVDKLHICPSKTRCVCFDGPSCPSSVANPCQPYKLPPPFPPTFTMESRGKRIECTPAGCDTIYFTTNLWQLAKENKSREDLNEHEYLSSLVLPGNGSTLNEYGLNWARRQCFDDKTKIFPRFLVPWYFSYNGIVTVGYRLCEQWIWKTGGHNQGQTTTFESIYITNQTSEERQQFPVASGDDQVSYVPVMIEFRSNSPPPVKQSTNRTTYITSFEIGKVDKNKFTLPKFCRFG